MGDDDDVAFLISDSDENAPVCSAQSSRRPVPRSSSTQSSRYPVPRVISAMSSRVPDLHGAQSSRVPDFHGAQSSRVPDLQGAQSQPSRVHICAAPSRSHRAFHIFTDPNHSLRAVMKIALVRPIRRALQMRVQLKTPALLLKTPKKLISTRAKTGYVPILTAFLRWVRQWRVFHALVAVGVKHYGRNVTYGEDAALRVDISEAIRARESS